MNEADFLYEEIYRRYGNIKRARGPFLYTAKGIRLTDLYQEGGKAILGWGSSDAFTQFKNVMNRGLTGSFNTDYTYRIGRAMDALLNSKRKTFILGSREECKNASSSLGLECTEYKPWLEEGIKWQEKDCISFVPPLPWAEDICLLSIKDGIELKSSINTVRISGALAEAVSRNIYDLIQALQEREEKEWFIYDTVVTKYWTRKGPYLYPKVNKESYKDFMLYCLDKGLVISPDYDTPSLVPYSADKGVFKALEKEPFIGTSKG